MKPCSRDPKSLLFPLFPNLPAELRISIWEFAAQEPRGIELIERFDQDISPDDGLPYSDDWILRPTFYGACTSNNRQQKIPPILLVCWEARFEGLRFYACCIELNVIPQGPYRKYSTRVVYINFKADVFYMLDTMAPYQTSSHNQLSDLNYTLNFGSSVIKRIENATVHTTISNLDHRFWRRAARYERNFLIKACPLIKSITYSCTGFYLWRNPPSQRATSLNSLLEDLKSRELLYLYFSRPSNEYSLEKAIWVNHRRRTLPSGNERRAVLSICYLRVGSYEVEEEYFSPDNSEKKAVCEKTTRGPH